METLKWILFLAANIPTYLIVGKIVFRSWDGFFETWDEHEFFGFGLPNLKLYVYCLWILATLAVEYHFLNGVVF